MKSTRMNAVLSQTAGELHLPSTLLQYLALSSEQFGSRPLQSSRSSSLPMILKEGSATATIDRACVRSALAAAFSRAVRDLSGVSGGGSGRENLQKSGGRENKSFVKFR